MGTRTWKEQILSMFFMRLYLGLMFGFRVGFR